MTAWVRLVRQRREFGAQIPQSFRTEYMDETGGYELPTHTMLMVCALSLCTLWVRVLMRMMLLAAWLSRLISPRTVWMEPPLPLSLVWSLPLSTTR